MLKLHKHRSNYWSCEQNAILYLSRERKLKPGEISERFMIPYTSVCRIIEECSVHEEDSPPKYIEKLCNAHYNDVMLRYIRNYCLNAKDSYTAKDIKHSMQFDLNICISSTQIRAFLKDDLQLSFKRGSSRPITTDHSRSLSTKHLFAIEFGRLWKQDHLYINIDEVLFSNKTKQNYSWLFKGRPGKIWNMHWVGSKSLIVAISSIGKWFAWFLTTTNKSKIFVSFMKSMLKWIEVDLWFSLGKTVIILDNLKIHKSKETLAYLTKSWALYVFLPTYAPEMAPIELIFGLIKRRLVKQTVGNSIKLSSKNGEREIREAFGTISNKEIRRSFDHCFEIIRSYIPK